MKKKEEYFKLTLNHSFGESLKRNGFCLIVKNQIGDIIITTNGTSYQYYKDILNYKNLINMFTVNVFKETIDLMFCMEDFYNDKKLKIVLYNDINEYKNDYGEGTNIGTTIDLKKSLNQKVQIYELMNVYSNDEGNTFKVINTYTKKLYNKE